MAQRYISDMTPKGEILTQQGVNSNEVFSFQKNITPGFSNPIGPEGESERGSLQMIFVLKGTLKGFVPVSKKAVLLINNNQHNLILKSRELQWQAEKGERDIICLSINFDFLSGYLPQDHRGLLNLINGLEKKEIALFSAQHLYISPEIISILNTLKSSTHTGYCERLFLESKVLELLMLQSSQVEQLSENFDELKDEEMIKMQEVKRIITENITTQYTLRQLAHMVGTNEFNLKRNFKVAFGVTVYGYLTQHKMELARSILLEQNITIADLAEKTGYKYATHFSSAFKRYFGYLPNMLRNTKNPSHSTKSSRP